MLLDLTFKLKKLKIAKPLLRNGKIKKTTFGSLKWEREMPQRKSDVKTKVLSPSKVVDHQVRILAIT